MAYQSDLQSEIHALQTRIDTVESKQERVESALEGNGSYLGTTDHDELTSSLRSLQKKGELLQEEKLILLRRQETFALGTRKGALAVAAPASQPPEPPGNSGASSAPVACGGVKRKSSEQPEEEESRESNGARRLSRSLAAGQTNNDGRSAVNTQQQNATMAAKEEPEHTLTIRLRDQTGEETYFRVRPSSKMRSIKGVYSRRKGVQASSLTLMLDGCYVKDEDTTVAGLGLQDQDQIDVRLDAQGGKPVILLYPPAPLDATVALELSPLWSFSALYPKPPSNNLPQASASKAIVAGGQRCKWNVHASPDGSLEDRSTGREYPYLFWEADSSHGRVSRSFGLDETRSFCVAGDAAGVFLDGALECLGLNMRERCDMVTYWLPQLESSPFNVIYFVNVERYEKAAHLTIVPAPDVTIRVFMAFRGVKAYDAELDTAKVEHLRAPARKGFVAVEWGGMNLNGIMQQ